MDACYFLTCGRSNYLTNKAVCYTVITTGISHIPANFFWDIGMRFLSWGCWDEDNTIISEDSRRILKSSENGRSSSPSLRTRINASSHGFRSLHGSELTYFWKLCQARRQQLTFLNQAWEIGLQPWAGVRSEFSTHRCES